MSEAPQRAVARASEPGWLVPLREAASGRSSPNIEVVHGAPPGLVASDAVHALTSALMAALVIAAAVLRSSLSLQGFDLILLLLRTVSVAFALRAALALVSWCRRLLRDTRASEHVLAWSPDGLLHRGPHGERWLAREDVLAFVLPELSGVAAALQPLYVVARPTREPVSWSLPPYFSAGAEVLAARLRRWRGTPVRQTPEFVPPADAPEPRYARAASGRLELGEVPVPEGFGYRLRAPYGVLLALVFVADAVAHAGVLRTRLLPAAAASALLAPCALAVWFTWMRKRRKVRLGMAMLLTPEELLVRGPHGAVSLPWTQLASAEVVTRQAWSPFVGRYLIRSLWFTAQDGITMQFDGAFLGVPPEVVAALAEAHRTGTLASQGSGGGGGISARADVTTSARSGT
jgi:hypothetical protein